MRLKNYNTYIFDCDGVILDSNNVKGEIFYEIASLYSADLAEEFLDFHEKNGGLNREHKFNYFFKSILKISNAEFETRKSLKLFNQMSLEKLKNTPLIAGVESFLSTVPKSSKKYVVSAGNHDEVIEILTFRGLSHLFNSINGGPASKPEIIKKLDILEPVVFFGDSKIDYDCSKIFGFDFVFISEGSSWKACPIPDNLTLFKADNFSSLIS
jgi:phosphoglycolate phosphatase-like HAD superfamily hydrolase